MSEATLAEVGDTRFPLGDDDRGDDDAPAVVVVVVVVVVALVGLVF